MFDEVIVEMLEKLVSSHTAGTIKIVGTTPEVCALLQERNLDMSNIQIWELQSQWEDMIVHIGADYIGMDPKIPELQVQLRGGHGCFLDVLQTMGFIYGGEFYLYI